MIVLAFDSFLCNNNVLLQLFSVTVDLVTGNSYPDDQNIACQVETSFSANNDRVAVRIKQNGYIEEISGDHQNLTATDFFTSKKLFLFKILLTEYIISCELSQKFVLENVVKNFYI